MRRREQLLALLVVWVALGVVPWTADPFETPKRLAVVLLALGLWVDRVLSGQPLGRASALTRWAGLAMVSASVSTLFSIHWPTSLWGGVHSQVGLGQLGATATIFLAAQRLAPNGVWRWALATSLVGVGLYALVQFAGLDPVAWESVATWCGRLRAFSTIGHPNALAVFLAMSTPLVLTHAVEAWRARTRWHLTALALAAALAGLGVVATFSRGGLLALGVGVAVTGGALAFAGVPRRWVQVVAATLLAATALSAVAFEPVAARVRTFFEAPTRLFLYRAAWAMFRDHPLLGTGPDTYQLAFQRYRDPAYWHLEWGATPQRAHSDLLELLAAQGLLGALIGLSGIALGLLLARRIWRKTDPTTRIRTAGVLGCLAAALAHAVVGFHVAASATLCAIAAGQLVALDTEHTPHAKPSGARTPLAVRAAWCAGIGCVALLFVVGPLVATVSRRSGEVALARGSADALDLFKRAAQATPWSAEAWSRYGVAAADEQALRRAVRLSGDDAFLRANLGRLLAQQAGGAMSEKADESAAEYDRAHTLDPANALLSLDAVASATRTGDLTRARRLAERLVGAYPQLGPAWSWLGHLAKLEGRDLESRVFFQNAVDADWHEDEAGRREALSDAAAALDGAGLAAQRDWLMQRRDAPTPAPIDHCP